MSAGCASPKAQEQDNITSGRRLQKGSIFALKQPSGSNEIPAPRRCLQGGHDAVAPPPSGLKFQGFHPEHTRGKWGGTTAPPPRGEAAPTNVADTGVNRRLEISLGPDPTYPSARVDSNKSATEPPDLNLGKDRHPSWHSPGAPNVDILAVLTAREPDQHHRPKTRRRAAGASTTQGRRLGVQTPLS